MPPRMRRPAQQALILGMLMPVIRTWRGLGNIAKPNQSFRGENSANQLEILPTVLAKIVDWRGFPGDDRTDCGRRCAQLLRREVRIPLHHQRRLPRAESTGYC